MVMGNSRFRSDAWNAPYLIPVLPTVLVAYAPTLPVNEYRVGIMNTYDVRSPQDVFR